MLISVDIYTAQYIDLSVNTISSFFKYSETKILVLSYTLQLKKIQFPYH